MFFLSFYNFFINQSYFFLIFFQIFSTNFVSFPKIFLQKIHSFNLIYSSNFFLQNFLLNKFVSLQKGFLALLNLQLLLILQNLQFLLKQIFKKFLFLLKFLHNTLLVINFPSKNLFFFPTFTNL